MVKFLNTPFGNYGYVLSRDPGIVNFSLPVSSDGIGRDYPRIRPSVYDAKFLRTTNLSTGSKTIKFIDSQSYMKHGLLHNGQQMIGPLESPICFSGQYITSPARGSSNRQSQSQARSKSSNRTQKGPKVMLEKQIPLTWQERANDSLEHAGRLTLIKHHRGFAYDYAANRSGLGALASNLGSGSTQSSRGLEGDVVDGEEIEKKKQALNLDGSGLVRVDPSGKTLSKLNKLKTKRMHEIYNEMYEKMDRHRRSLILKRIRTAEKIKDELHEDEVEKQREILKSSINSQREQLRELRNRHDKDFNSRIQSVYHSKSSSKHADRMPDVAEDGQGLKKPVIPRLALPRKVYGLPENEVKDRPETVPLKPLYRFKPGRLLMQSYEQTRNNLPTKFNNVWTKASPTSTPRKITT